MSTPLLPRLNEENKIAITKRGEWISDTQNTLKNLVADLKVTTDFKSNITSIPDLWARPAMYEMVLFDEKHHLHQKYVAEWRGILAMLAFREMRNLKDIKREEILVPEKGQLDAAAPSFLRVLAGLLPEEYKEYPDNTVERGYKIQLLASNEGPLAIIWPTILVCPAVGLDKMVSALSCSVTWWGSYGINDPVSSLSNQEKALLAKWLDDIKEGLPTNAKSNKLIKLLSEFQNDLGSKEKPNNYGLGTGLNITGFCRLIDKPIRCSIDEKQFLEASNVMLINRRNQAAKKLLVMTADMYKQWNKAASDIIVAGNINLDAALPYGGSLPIKNRINDIDLSQYNAELRMGEDFFTEKICLIPSEKDLFPNAINNYKINYNCAIYNVLLPLKREMLNYISPEYIAEKFRITSVEDGIKVEMELPLKGFDESGKELKIFKIYRITDISDVRNSEIVDYLQAPVLQIWPNFIPYYPDKWQAYYSFYDTDGGTFYAKPLWDEDDCESRRLNFSNGMQAEIVKGKEFPEGFSCTYTFEMFSGNVEEELGLILLQKPHRLELSGNNAIKIGVDFGTTNSLVYMLSDGGAPELLRLKNRLYPVTEINKEAEGELRRHFFAASEQPNGDSISIRTVFNPSEGAFNGNLNQAVFPGMIYYLDGIDNIGKDKNVRNLIQGKDMKWNSDGKLQYMQAFLFQLTMQCMAEAVVAGASNIEWYYSYPKAFGDTQIDDLKDTWNKIVKFCNSVSPNISTKAAEAKTESTAMALFFLSPEMRATLNRGLICFDIGGGSTDIAIWQSSNKSEPVGRCSFLFAGQDILNRQLYENRNTLLSFQNNNEEFNGFLQKLYDIPKGRYNDFNIALEALLKYKQNMLLEGMQEKSSLKDVKLLLRNIAFALSGIFYYTGIVVGKNIDIAASSGVPMCYIGGNASKLLDWVDNGNYTENSKFGKVYKICLLEGLNTVQRFSKDKADIWLKKSPKPKEEVAFGLVYQSNLLRTNEAKSDEEEYGSFFDDPDDDILDTNDVVAGEYVRVRGNDRNADGYISKQDIIAGVTVDSAMPNFRRFLNGFNKLIKSKDFNGEYQINFTEMDFNELRDQTNEFLDEQSEMEEGKISIEPPFITILKQALILLYK